MSAAASVRSFVCQAFPDQPLGDDDDIFELGFANSLFAMQLVEFIESEFQIVVEEEDLEIENFNTVNHIAQLVERKQARHGTEPGERLRGLG